MKKKVINISKEKKSFQRDMEKKFNIVCTPIRSSFVVIASKTSSKAEAERKRKEK
jgi:hypothetical protein